MTKSKRNLHWCRSISKKNTCACFITVSVNKLLHYRAGGLLQYRAFYYIIGQLLHYRAFFYYIIGHVLQYRAFIPLSVGTGDTGSRPNIPTISNLDLADEKHSAQFFLK